MVDEWIRIQIILGEVDERVEHVKMENDMKEKEKIERRKNVPASSASFIIIKILNSVKIDIHQQPRLVESARERECMKRIIT